MRILIKECGQLLKWLEEQKVEAEEKPDEEKHIYAGMIREYQFVLTKSEICCKRHRLSWTKYLQIRKARCAVEEGMEMTIPADVLYTYAR